MTDNIEVKLSRAYKLGGKETDKISFREPKLADLITVESVADGDKPHAMTAIMMAQLSGATQPEISEFSLADYAACDKAMRPFMVIADQGGGD
jgi:hypothetical protein